jgi:NADPH:quinone reductase-like Zn-dependent oxidoreductase
MPFNTAAWLPAKRAQLKVGAAPYTSPGENQIVVKNRALAINPVDWFIQAAGGLIFGFLKCPFILGSDLAGEVVEVGVGVSRFKVGDRVVAHAIGMDPNVNNASQSAFQTYTVIVEHMASPIPDSLSFEQAAVIPLGVSTAACGLFQKDFLALAYPSAHPTPTGQALVIWGGSTSVGANAIQLAVAAGYEVFTTASPRNFDFCRQLGASQVFDYNSKTVVPDMIQALKGKTLAGALAIGSTSSAACLDIVHACPGRKFVSMASFPLALDRLSDGPEMILQFIAMMPGMALHGASMALKARTRGIGTKFVFGSSLMANAVGPMIYADFLPSALAEGRFIAAPEPVVVGSGLEAVQTGFDAQRRGVSARKVVVSLP